MIRSSGLGYSYGGEPLIEFPNIHLAQGEHLLLQGPSGCGKSTLLALLAGLRRPTQGELTVGGQNLRQFSANALDAWRGESIGMLPQRLHLSHALDVRGNLALAYFATGKSVDAARIALVLELLGLSGFATRRTWELSVGQAQRVALARALLLSPRLILADEPTASLDDEAAEAAVNLLQSCAAQAGASLIVATHDARVRAAMPRAAQVLWPSRALQDQAAQGVPA